MPLPTHLPAQVRVGARERLRVAGKDGHAALNIWSLPDRAQTSTGPGARPRSWIPRCDRVWVANRGQDLHTALTIGRTWAPPRVAERGELRCSPDPEIPGPLKDVRTPPECPSLTRRPRGMRRYTPRFDLSQIHSMTGVALPDWEFDWVARPGDCNTPTLEVSRSCQSAIRPIARSTAAVEGAVRSVGGHRLTRCTVHSPCRWRHPQVRHCLSLLYVLSHPAYSATGPGVLKPVATVLRYQDI